MQVIDFQLTRMILQEKI